MEALELCPVFVLLPRTLTMSQFVVVRELITEES
jgi:hypothetical protein